MEIGSWVAAAGVMPAAADGLQVAGRAPRGLAAGTMTKGCIRCPSSAAASRVAAEVRILNWTLNPHRGGKGPPGDDPKGKGKKGDFQEGKGQKGPADDTGFKGKGKGKGKDPDDPDAAPSGGDGFVQKGKKGQKGYPHGGGGGGGKGRPRGGPGRGDRTHMDDIPEGGPIDRVLRVIADLQDKIRQRLLACHWTIVSTLSRVRLTLNLPQADGAPL